MSRKDFTLNNGMRVMLEETGHRRAYATLRVRCGSAHELSGEEGLAHFLEHCIMKGGTKNYTSETVRELRSDFAHMNACTGIGNTEIYGSMISGKLPDFLKLSSEIAFSPKLEIEHVEHERQRVLREMADYKGSPSYKDMRDHIEFLFKDHPMKKPILGKESVIRSASSEDLRKFHSRGYNASNMNLIIAGGIPDGTLELICSEFGKYPKGNRLEISMPILSPLEKKRIFKRHAPELYNSDCPEDSSAQLFINLVTAPLSHPDNYAVSMMAYILGGPTVNSRIFSKVSEEMGAAYSISSSYDGTNNNGIIDIRGNIQSGMLEEAIDAIFSEMKTLREELVPEKDVLQAINHGVYWLDSGLETIEGKVSEMQKIMNYGVSTEDNIRELKKVTPEAVRDVARKYLPASRENGKYAMMIRDPLVK